jgi:hypothetical protein
MATNGRRRRRPVPSPDVEVKLSLWSPSDRDQRQPSRAHLKHFDVQNFSVEESITKSTRFTEWQPHPHSQDAIYVRADQRQRPRT